MVNINIDGTEVAVPDDSTILTAARSVGIDIPTLCYFRKDKDDESPELEIADSSCLVCLVRANGRIVPACATKVQEAMTIESESDEIRQLRRTALELLLSDHSGDCVAPCQSACPARLDIPKMLRQIGDGDLKGAIRTVREKIALPSILGRICSRPCEKVCRRGKADGAVSICHLKRFVADTDLGSGVPVSVQIPETTFHNVAVLGAGPAGLAAAYYLTLAGRQVTLFEKESVCGGRLRQFDENELPLDVLETELNYLILFPVPNKIDLRLDSDVDWSDPIQRRELCDNFDAVLLAFGRETAERLKNRREKRLDSTDALHRGDFEESRADSAIATDSTVEARPAASDFNSTFDQNGENVADVEYCLRGVNVSFQYQTAIPSVFAVGTAIRNGNVLVVRSVADGREAAESIDLFLKRQEEKSDDESVALISNEENRSANRFLARTKWSEAETAEFQRNAVASERCEPVDAGIDEYSLEEARTQAKRCFRCDCRKKESCRLLKAARRCDVRPEQWGGSRPQIRIVRSGRLVYEPAKCIKCGLCVKITQTFGEKIGLTFVGRGFDIRVDAPFCQSLETALTQTAKLCVQACPTGALSFDR